MNEAVLIELLDQIEQELRSIGFWKTEQIDPYESLPEGETPSFLNASSFEDWLQFVFLPNARQAVKTADLPEKSMVGVMALRQYDYHSRVPGTERLLRLLNDFDRQINGVGKSLNPGSSDERP